MAEFQINGKDYELEFTLGAFRQQAKDVKQNKLEGMDATFSLIEAAYFFANKRKGEKTTNEMRKELKDDLDLGSLSELTLLNDFVLELSGANKTEEDPN